MFTVFALTSQAEFVASGSFEFSHVVLLLKTLPTSDIVSTRMAELNRLFTSLTHD